MGKHHVCVNFGVLSSVFSLLGAGFSAPFSFVSDYCRLSVDQALIPEKIHYLGWMGENTIVFLFFACMFFWFGSLLPDADSRESVVGRVFYLPFKHRRMTHTFWTLGILSFAWSFHIWFKWLWLGYFLHILGDAFSKAGVRWLYPLTRYKEYESGAFIAEGHRFQWYRAGKKSETRFVVLVLLFCILWDLFFGVYLDGFVNLWNYAMC